jgi:hypothetical protein
MPVEIRELVLRAVIDPNLARGESDSVDEGGPSGAPEDREAIVRECVRQVLRILEKSRER